MRILFVSQQRLLRESLSIAFSDRPGVTFLPPAAGIEEVVELTLLQNPEVILVDLNPALSGILVAKKLQQACEGCRIVVLASHADAVTEGQLLLAGVKAVISKNVGLDELHQALQEAGSDEPVQASSSIAVPDGAGKLAGSPLTARETQILERVAQGFANKQIAADLGISIKTVEKHRQKVMCKLRAHETAGLTWRAACLGIARTSCLAVFAH